jgi:histidyl-tRNA synthetase
MAIIDKSASFGMQNWFAVSIDETSDGTYNFYGFVNKRNSILIMRTDKTPAEVRYYLTTGTYSSIWAARAGYTYVLPNQLIDQNV